MLPLEQPDRIHVAFDDHRLVANAGLLLPVTLARRLGDAPVVMASALAGGDCIDDATRARWGNRSGALCDQGAVHAGDLPAEFPVGPRAPGPGEPAVAGWGLGRWCGTRRRAVDHRPGLHHLRNLRAGEGGGARPRLPGQRGYHPLLAVAAGTGDVLMARLRQGRANTARGAAHFLRETVGRVRQAGRQRLAPTPWSPAARRKSASPSPPDSTQVCAVSSRPYPRQSGRPSPIGWRAPPTWPRLTTRPSRANPTPAAHRTQGQAHARLPTGAVHQLQLSRLHHRPGRRYPGPRGRPSPPRRDRERHPRPQVRRGAQPPPLGNATWLRPGMDLDAGQHPNGNHQIGRTISTSSMNRERDQTEYRQAESSSARRLQHRLA